MAVGEHKAVAIRPRGIARVVLQWAAPQRLGQVRHAHGRARVPGVGSLDRIHGEDTKGIGKAAAVGHEGLL